MLDSNVLIPQSLVRIAVEGKGNMKNQTTEKGIGKEVFIPPA